VLKKGDHKNQESMFDLTLTKEIHDEENENYQSSDSLEREGELS
jgi:hypothetical protein